MRTLGSVTQLAVDEDHRPAGSGSPGDLQPEGDPGTGNGVSAPDRRRGWTAGPTRYRQHRIVPGPSRPDRAVRLRPAEGCLLDSSRTEASSLHHSEHGHG